jgi:hypothetical protein
MQLITASRRAAALAVACAALAAPAFAGHRAAQNPDPFAVKVDKKKVVVPVARESIVEPPSLAERAKTCRAATPAGTSVEDTPCMYLVRELAFTGVSESEAGVEAFVFAAATKQTLVVREGDRLFDGRVVAIREPGSADSPTLVLEKTTTKQIGRKLVTSTSTVTLGLASPGAGQ